MMGTYHIVPVNDIREHLLDGLICWCGPKDKWEPDGSVLVIHNSADARELVEEHGIQ